MLFGLREFRRGALRLLGSFPPEQPPGERFPASFPVHVGGSWRPISGSWRRISGSWRRIRKAALCKRARLGFRRVRLGAPSSSGEGGIRTHGTLAGTLVFETSTIGRSVTSPVPLWRDFDDTLPFENAPRQACGAAGLRASRRPGQLPALGGGDFSKTPRVRPAARSVRGSLLADCARAPPTCSGLSPRETLARGERSLP